MPKTALEVLNACSHLISPAKAHFTHERALSVSEAK